MNTLNLRPIGVTECGESGFALHLDPQYRPALKGLDGFSHVQVLWWFDGCGDGAGSVLVEDKPYRKGPERLGAFATRSPNRPNPVALSFAGTTFIDEENGIVGLTYIDANDGTPLLDLKPYTSSLDRVEKPSVPEWCGHWPGCCENSGDFDWEAEFNF
jgi:tRNA (Thr-GGU) A37 N-methylase